MVVLCAFICVRIPRWQRSRTGTVARVMLAHTGEQRNSSSADRLQLHTTAWSFPRSKLRNARKTRLTHRINCYFRRRQCSRAQKYVIPLI